MEITQNMIKTLELKIESLEAENQKYLSNIEANNKEIQKYKSIIQSLKQNNNFDNIQINDNSNVIDLKFKWKISEARKLLCELKNDSKTIKKFNGDCLWNCTAIGDRCLIKGKTNRFKIQVKNLGKSPEIYFGIVPSNIDLNGINNYKLSYSTDLANFNKHNLGVYTATYNISAKKDDIVEIIVDLEKWKLSFILNGTDLGIYCEDISKNIDYVPFIDIYYIGTEISLI